jgi:hypothetical protein
MTHPTDTPAPSASRTAEDWPTITLSAPIVRGDQEIASIQLRKPKAGELRGLSLQDVINSDITALLQLLPRITVPPLIDQEVNEIDPADLAEMGGTIRSFFMTAAERRLMEAILAEHQPKI